MLARSEILARFFTFIRRKQAMLFMCNALVDQDDPGRANLLFRLVHRKRMSLGVPSNKFLAEWSWPAVCELCLELGFVCKTGESTGSAYVVPPVTKRELAQLCQDPKGFVESRIAENAVTRCE